MDYVNSMFRSDQMADKFQFFPIPCRHTIQQDELILIPSEEANDLSNWGDYSQRRRKAARAFLVNDVDGKSIDNKKKKIIHRDIERQRRQEMATLYRALRLQLPLEYLKGKRSISDHMHEAVNYIKHLQKKILKLSGRRDELKSSSNSYASRSVPESLQDSSEHSVMVRPCLAGVEVVISTCLRQGLNLSSVLEVILAEGLSVVTCISTKVNESLMHTIVSEVNDGTNIEPSELQQKLTMLATSSSELHLDVAFADSHADDQINSEGPKKRKSQSKRYRGDLGLRNMDCAASEFPSEESTVELFQFFSIPCQQDSSNPKQDEQNLILVSKKSDCSRGKRKAATAFGVEDGNAPDSKGKKIIHRDIERQRRQEMTTLYSTLRLLLPLEYLKGKRSISDHMHEAVKYIKHLQNRITELSDKREELKRSSNLHTPSSMPESSPDCSEDSVVVRGCMVGVEIAINTGLRPGLPLSNVLDVIVAEGLSVVNCISTKVNERLLHTIVLEVNDGRSIELSELQQKLTKLIIRPPG
ncbi:Myc-type [Theobroma cacao]|nr:Myc-type [Theobroma cacao]